jgi:Voltage gated chloride channel
MRWDARWRQIKRFPQATATLKMRDVADVGSVLSPRIAVGKFLLTLLGFLVRASIGKEGPTVQIGCAAMNICGRIGLQRTQALQWVLIFADGIFAPPLAVRVGLGTEFVHIVPGLPVVRSRWLAWLATCPGWYRRRLPPPRSSLK